MMSASALSNLANVSAQFNLTPQGHVMMTQGRVQTDLGGGVQQLFQSHNAAGKEVAFEWRTNGMLAEFNGQSFINVGSANQAALDASGFLLFTNNDTLSLASGVPGSAVTLLKGIQGLTTDATGKSQIQIGSLVKADVDFTLNAAATSAIVRFSNVQVNVGGFLNNIITDIQSFTKPLENLANTLNSPLLPEGWATSLTPLNLLSMMGYDTASAKSFATAVQDLNKLSASSAGWVSLGAAGNFEAEASANTAALTYLTAPDLSAVNAVLSPLTSMNIPGLTVGLGDWQQFAKMLSGAPANLFSYTLSLSPPLSIAQFDQRLATIPVSPETGTELDLDLIGSFGLSGGATFGLDSSILQSGNLANSLYVDNANVTGNIQVGLAGTINEAYLVGYRITGELAGDPSVSLPGKVTVSQIQNGSVKAKVSGGTLQPEIVTSTLGPQQLLGELVTLLGARRRGRAQSGCQ